MNWDVCRESGGCSSVGLVVAAAIAAWGWTGNRSALAALNVESAQTRSALEGQIKAASDKLAAAEGQIKAGSDKLAAAEGQIRPERQARGAKAKPRA